MLFSGQLEIRKYTHFIFKDLFSEDRLEEYLEDIKNGVIKVSVVEPL